MILYIDTTDFNKATFAISLDGGLQGAGRPPSRAGGIHQKSYKIDSHKSYETLAKLDEFLKSVKIKPSPFGLLGSPSPRGGGGEQRIKKIMVNKGPGSYTGVRVGVTIAQALGFAWGVPVKAVAKDKFRI